MPRNFRLLLPAALAVFILALPLRADRIVAVGDVHGEYDGFVSILRQAGVINESLEWTGGRTTLVQTGDMTDRGKDVRKVFDLMMKLEREAPRRNGRVVVLLGNHELMNLTSAVHDVNPESYEAFTDRNSERRRQAGYRDYQALYQRLLRRYPQTPPRLKSESEWMEDHPLGYIEYQEAIGRNGRYGRWLRDKAVIAKVGDSIFLHGGVSPKAEETTLREINDRVSREIEAFDRIRDYLVAERLILPFSTINEISEVVNLEAQWYAGGRTSDMRRVIAAFRSLHDWSIYHPDGPLWFRGFGEWSDEEGEELISPLLKRFGARHFVVGHTIPRDASQILPRFGGKVFLIDTAMLRGYGRNGRAAALEINGDTVTAIYETERVVLIRSREAAVHAGDSERLKSSGRGELSAFGRNDARPFSSNGIVLARLRDDAYATGPFLRTRISDGSAAERTWLGPGDKPLPLRTYIEITEFLRTAKPVKIDKSRLHGVTKPEKVLVESGRIRSNAVFRSQHREEENTHWETGTFTELLKDSYKSEVAAYELSLLLGLDAVPPAVTWVLNGRPGSLQIFIEKARPGFHEQESAKPADPVRYQKELDNMHIFDALIGNLDRHEGNMLVDSTGKVWWIDHSRSFMRERQVHNADLIQRCDRQLWQALRAVSAETITERLAPYMGPREIEALLERRAHLVKLIEERIAENGEDAVLFTLGSAGLPRSAGLDAHLDVLDILMELAGDAAA
jgi:hypothetical protein